MLLRMKHILTKYEKSITHLTNKCEAQAEEITRLKAELEMKNK